MTESNERPPFNGLSEEEIEHLIEKVSERVIERFYAGVGESVVRKFLWLVGFVVVGLATYFGLVNKASS